MINKLEKILRVDTRYVLKGGLFLSATNFASLILGFALSIAFANLLEPEAYGRYKYVTSAAIILGSFTLTGLGSAVIQNVARGFEGSLKINFFRNIRWSVFMFIAALSAAIYYFINDNIFLATSFFLIAIFIPPTRSTGLYKAYLNGKKDFKTIAYTDISRRACVTMALIVTVVITQNPLIIFIVFLATELLISTLFYAYTTKKYKPNSNYDSEDTTYGIHLSVVNGIKNIGAHIDKIFMFQWIGSQQLAMYSVAMAPVTEIAGVDKTIATLAFPKLSQRKYSEIRTTLIRKMLIMMAIMFSMAILYTVAAPHIFNLIFPKYVDAVFYSQLLVTSTVLAPALLIIQAFIAHKKLTELYIIRFSTPVMQIGLLAFLLPKYGILGAVIAFLIARAFWFFLSLALFLRSK